MAGGGVCTDQLDAPSPVLSSDLAADKRVPLCIVPKLRSLSFFLFSLFNITCEFIGFYRSYIDFGATCFILVSQDGSCRIYELWRHCALCHSTTTPKASMTGKQTDQ